MRITKAYHFITGTGNHTFCMTPRNLFRIILKVIGIFFIKEIIALLPNVVSVAYYAARPDMKGAVYILIGTAATLAAYALVIYYLLFRTDYIIEKLSLDRGFDQEMLPVNIGRSAVISIAVIIVGGYMVADEIPNLCRQLYHYFLQKYVEFSPVEITLAAMLTAVAKIIIGLLLMENHRSIVNLIERRQPPPEKESGDILDNY